MQKFKYSLKTGPGDYNTVAILEVPGDTAVLHIRDILEKVYNHPVEVRKEVWTRVD